MPSPSHLGPSGNGRPGQTFTRAPPSLSRSRRAGSSSPGAARAAEPPRRSSTSSSRGSSRRNRRSSRDELVGRPGREPRALERRARLGIRHLVRGVTLEPGELASPALPGRVGDERVDVVREELERRRLAVLLALEQEWRERREENDGLREPELRGRQAVAERPVADLVVVLGAGDEPRSFLTRELAGDRGHRAVEAGVVAVALAGQRDVELVMERVEPHRVVPPIAQRPEVLLPHLADHERVGRGGANAARELGEHMFWRVVLDRVDGVEPEPVELVLAHPELGVLDRPFAHARLAVVERLAPGRLAEAVGEVGAEAAERLVPRPDVVVDDVQEDAEARSVGRVHEAGELLRAAVRLVRRGRVEAVVAPAAPPGERRDGHQLDRGHPEVAQPGEPRDHAGERALRREGADVQLVDDELVQPQPGTGRDLEAGGIDHARRAADAFGLGARAGVRPRLAAVEHEAIVVARAGCDLAGPEASLLLGELVRGAGADLHRERARERGPSSELDRPPASSSGLGHERAERSLSHDRHPRNLPRPATASNVLPRRLRRAEAAHRPEGEAADQAEARGRTRAGRRPRSPRAGSAPPRART